MDAIDEDLLLRLTMPGKSLKKNLVKEMLDRAKETPAVESTPTSSIIQNENTGAILNPAPTPISNEQPKESCRLPDATNPTTPFSEKKVTEPQAVPEPLPPKPNESIGYHEERPVETGAVTPTTQSTELDPQDSLLQHVTLAKKSTGSIIIEREKPTDTKEDPYIYKYGHPHLGASFDMNHVKDLTKKLFNSDSPLTVLRKKR